VHLSNHHRNTLRQIFEHPVSHNVEWRAVVSLLEAVGSVVQHHDGKVAVTVGSQTAIFDPPADKDIDIQTVVDLRRMLSAAGYSPASKHVLLWLTRSSARTSRIGRRPGPCGLLAGGAPLPTPAAAAVAHQRPGEAGDDVNAEAEARDEHARLHVALEADEQAAVGGDHGEQDRQPGLAAQHQGAAITLGGPGQQDRQAGDRGSRWPGHVMRLLLAQWSYCSHVFANAPGLGCT
jgi:hypothetical protein